MHGSHFPFGINKIFTTIPMRLTHSDAEKRYEAIRTAALQSTMTKLPVIPGLALRLIDGEALRASQEWRFTGARRVHWDWLDGYGSFRYRYPKRFELAIWNGDQLISLTLGRPTYHGAGLRLDFIEANQDSNRIRVLPIVMVALTTYAEALGANEIRIMNPINDAVKAYYEKAGLVYVKNGDYLYTRL